MKFLVTLMLVVLSSVALASGSPGYKQPAAVEFLLNRASPDAMPLTQLGTQITRKKVQVLNALLDFAVTGATVATVNLKDFDGKDAVLPAGAIIRQVIVHPVVAVTSLGAPTLTLGVNTASDLLGSTLKAALTLDAIVAGVPVGTAATMVRVSSQKVITGTIGTNVWTAGKVEVFIEYYLGR